MNVIRNNPYRTLGLIANSKERELQKQIAKLKAYSATGKILESDFDFRFLGDINRNKENIEKASGKIEQAKNKVLYALFWFVNIGSVDEVALNHLKEGHIEKAAEIWEKTTKELSVNSKNFAAISNLSTLQMGIVTYNGSFNIQKFTNAIEMKRKLLLSNAFENFCISVIGEGVSLKKDDLLKEFADEVLLLIKPYLLADNGEVLCEFINAFRLFPNEIRQYITGKFTNKPTDNIETQIELIKKKREDEPETALNYGEKLYKDTKEDLIYLKKLLGAENVQFQIIANKLANEILQCAIDYFVEHKEDLDFDPGESSIKVMKMAKAINPTGHTKSRIDENIENLREWIDDGDLRKEQRKIVADFEFIGNKLKQFQGALYTIESAKELVDSCKPSLVKIKEVLGETNDLYLNISSAVVNNAMNLIITVINSEQSTFAINRSENSLLSVVSSAISVLNLIQSMDMVFELRERFNKNKDAIIDIKLQLNNFTNRSSNYYSGTNNSDRSSSACYIATMVYGSYEHPQVLKLRNFRDKILSKSDFGRGFIKIYYKYSPILVEHFKDKFILKKTIKLFLNIIIRFLK